MSQSVPEPISELIEKWRGGDREALNDLIPVIYRELHTLAHGYLRGERSGHTLQTTALVHEAYLRLLQQGPFQTQNKEHLVAVSAMLMRQILVDWARAHNAEKRGAALRVALDEGLDMPHFRDNDIVALDDALQDLARLDTRQARIVELRFFGGLSVEEVAMVLDLSPATAKRDWRFAKAWLTRELNRGDHGQSAALGKD